MSTRPRVTGIGTSGWHRSVEVVTPDRQTVTVDRDMAPLLRWLWRAGYETTSSCQSAQNSGWAWLRLADAEQAERVAGLIDPTRLPRADGRDVTFRRQPSLCVSHVVVSDCDGSRRSGR